MLLAGRDEVGRPVGVGDERRAERAAGPADEAVEAFEVDAELRRGPGSRVTRKRTSTALSGVGDGEVELLVVVTTCAPAGPPTSSQCSGGATDWAPRGGVERGLDADGVRGLAQGGSDGTPPECAHGGGQRGARRAEGAREGLVEVEGRLRARARVGAERAA